MRLVKAKVPEGMGEAVAELALQAGVSQVGVYTQDVIHKGGRRERKQVVDIATATPTARKYVDALVAAPFYNPQTYSYEIRDAHAIYSSDTTEQVTPPIVEPASEVAEELWQFSYVTPSFVVRVLVASLLLAFGMIHQKMPLIVSGLLFLPYLPVLLGMGFGALTRQWSLVRQAFVAFIAETAIAVAGGAIVAFLTHGPLEYADFTPLLTGLLFSLAIGAAAGFATTDDVGWRQLIGLAAASQMAFVPVWLGIALVYGFADKGTVAPPERALGFIVNAIAIVLAALGTYAVLGMARHRFTSYKRTAPPEEKPAAVDTAVQQAA
jgi:hypothetical protein